MISKDYLITAADGIHARPATVLIRLTRKYKSDVSLKKDQKVVRLNSMLNILGLGTKGGDVITVIVDGEDEDAASQAIEDFFKEELRKM